jgi:3'-phosphoadenosine 5'-phosphosulfate sulfotransferase (PAPS reductase)/FAD synthetase
VIKNRIVSWFSCGAASAVATKLAIAEHKNVQVVYCEVKEEHPDNKRFLKDCEEWFGQKILVLGNDEYKRSIDEVFWRRKYLAGISGAPCTLLLKKRIREDYEKPNDVQIMGYTLEEQHRVDRFIDANPDVDLVTPLIDKGLKKEDCLAMVHNAGIELPTMYKLGYKNNNCMGCVKASSPAYWKKIQIDFPKRFEIMRAFEIMTGASICKTTIDGVKDVRIKLDQLPEHINPLDDTVDIQCGIFCMMAEQDIAGAT